MLPTRFIRSVSRVRQSVLRPHQLQVEMPVQTFNWTKTLFSDSKAYAIWWQHITLCIKLLPFEKFIQLTPIQCLKRHLYPTQEVQWNTIALNSLCPAHFSLISHWLVKMPATKIPIGRMLPVVTLPLARWDWEPSHCFVPLCGQQQGSIEWEEEEN